MWSSAAAVDVEKAMEQGGNRITVVGGRGVGVWMTQGLRWDVKGVKVLIM